jgi:ABC-type sulfate transport system substrate-binding protein
VIITVSVALHHICEGIMRDVHNVDYVPFVHDAREAQDANETENTTVFRAHQTGDVLAMPQEEALSQDQAQAQEQFQAQPPEQLRAQEQVQPQVI